MYTTIRTLFVLITLVVLCSLTGCATYTRTPWGSSYTYNGQTTYYAAPESPVYHHAEAFPGYYCNFYSIGTGANMRIYRGDCHDNH